jgi:hypothetical protein
MKINCYRFECEVCQEVSSIQVFVKSNGEISYGRARHKSDKFYYHKLSRYYIEQKLGELTLVDHGQVLAKTVDHKVSKVSNSVSKGVEAGPMGFEPMTFSLEG